jgi:malate synthase
MQQMTMISERHYELINFLFTWFISSVFVMSYSYPRDPSDSDYYLVGSPGSIKAHRIFTECVERDILPGTGVDSAKFWSLLEAVVSRFTRENYELLKYRDHLQVEIDEWYRTGCQTDQGDFLRKIGYLVQNPECNDLTITTSNIDREIAAVSSPQLVVPVDNDRFVVNAVNSRWGSLSAALSTTDVLAKNPSTAQVHEYMMSFLDQAVPLITKDASWKDVRSVQASRLGGSKGASLRIVLNDGRVSGLQTHQAWIGWALNAVFLQHHGLHIWIQTSSEGVIKDVVLESSLTAIMDLEDSVAAVDSSDKMKAYRNWAKVMAGDLSVDLGGGKVRNFREDIFFRTPTGVRRSLPGRVLSLVRNVGIHCKTNLVLHCADNTEVYEGLIDAVVTIVAALRDLRSTNANRSNSRAGSIYIVKPKLHGPNEVRFACSVFAFIEAKLGIPLNTVKIGIMDEERRTSVNLRSCIDVAQNRVFFVNTGFLDRTGDEIHTCMRGGPVLPKAKIKQAAWIMAYEKLNVINGVAAGFLGKAQIGKGMWAEPDSMKAMMDQKIAHPRAAASTAWVPSPTAATLHAIHYHLVNVKAVQRSIDVTSSVAPLESDLLKPPLMTRDELAALTEEEIRNELLNNAQGILGYVVRWVDMGVGCSKVPDIRNVGLMEDLATLRISSQHIANWLLHGLVSEKEVISAFKEMAKTVDSQNARDPKYVPMCKDLENNIAFNVAIDLVKQGTRLPNGYSIGVLFEARRKVKQLQASKMRRSASL